MWCSPWIPSLRAVIAGDIMFSGAHFTPPKMPEEWLKTLDQVVDVDYYLPGCPPTPKLLGQALEALLSGQVPPKGTVLAPDIALCEPSLVEPSKKPALSMRPLRSSGGGLWPNP